MHALGRIQLSLLLILFIAVVTITFRWQAIFSDMSRTLPGAAAAAAEDNNEIIHIDPMLRYDESDPRIAKARDRIDARFCGGPCRFLLPVFIMEQESKAQMHFRQLAFMAGMINRTIVLPNVGGSRLGACQEHNFSLYYSEQWAKDNSQYFRYITMSDFKAWLKERNALGVRAKSQTLHIHLGRSQHKNLGETDNCLAPLMNMNTLPERSLYLQDSGNAQRRRPYQKIIREFLTGKTTNTALVDDDVQDDNGISQKHRQRQYTEDDFSFVTQNLEVLSVYYDRRYPFIQHPAADVPIPYSETITQVANDIARQMAPYWAIHWRTERVEPAENLVGCAESLVSLLKSHIKTFAASSPKTPAIFLLTDYPHVFSQEAIEEAIENNTTESLNPASASFSSYYFTRYHHLAIQYLYQNLPVHVTNLIDDQGEDEDDDDMHLPSNWTVIPISASQAGHDSGILGILDKLLAIRSDLFIAGRPGVCARKSSFTTRIINERLNVLGDNNVTLEDDWEGRGPGAIMNIIEYFDLPQDESDEE